MKSNMPVRPQLSATDSYPDLSAKMFLDAALQLLPRSNTNDAGLRVDLPDGNALRMRNLVHRGTQRPVFKVPSLKLKRTVQCESILEYEAALILDAAPQVGSFGEQPARIHYMLNGDPRSHIPDFAVLLNDRKAFLEIKFAKDVGADVRERTKLLEGGLRVLGWDYFLLTEDTLRRGALLSNVQGILRRARHAVCGVETLRTLERLRVTRGQTLEDFNWTTSGSSQAASIAQLITTGLATVDVSHALCGSSPVWATESINVGEAAQWLLAPFA
jgi:hypothetical protein